jgi:glucosamine--fructose-6-phosphate aminotransferase (isomerizing)
MPQDHAADTRTAHPFHMYEAILAQPALCGQLLAGEQRSTIERAAEAAAQRKRLLLTGLGTSYHAAIAANHFLRRLSNGNAAPLIEESFEWIHYAYAVGGEDAAILISHGGSNRYLIRAKEFFQSAGALTIAVTGKNSAEAMRSCDFLIETCDQEKSGAHTKSYTTTLAALAHFSVEYAQHNHFLKSHSMMRAAVERVPERMRRALACEGKARGIARQAARRERWFFIGAGPNWPTACEAALKMKETSYLRAEGCETEQFLHGPIAELDARCCVCAFLTGGPADERARELLRAAGETEALRIAIASAQLKNIPAEHVLEVPRGEEWLSPMVAIIPAQFLCYFVALERGANPDTNRREQPAHAAAHKHFEL